VFLKSFLNLLPNINQETPNFPPTILYNEGWLLKLITDWFSISGITDHPLSFPKDGHWFSEASLPSAFLPRFKGDPLAESHTNADGVIGHFMIGTKGKTDLELIPDATHFVVLEAKLYSGLSKGVTHAKYYDQAARSVACIAEVLRRADRKPKSFSQLGFYVLAPQDQIKSRMFSRYLDKQSIKDKVKRRKKPYDRELDEWFKEWFIPTLEKIEIRSISWEAVLDTINKEDSEIGGSLFEYYSLCLRFNS
jgi:hypothetical protein